MLCIGHQPMKSVRTLINSNKDIKIAWKVLKFEEKVFYTPDHLDPVKEKTVVFSHFDLSMKFRCSVQNFRHSFLKSQCMSYVGFVEALKRLHFSMSILGFCIINSISFRKNYEIWMPKYAHAARHLTLNKI